jgi:hypothetical protein
MNGIATVASPPTVPITRDGQLWGSAAKRCGLPAHSLQPTPRLELRVQRPVDNLRYITLAIAVLSLVHRSK